MTQVSYKPRINSRFKLNIIITSYASEDSEKWKLFLHSLSLSFQNWILSSLKRRFSSESWCCEKKYQMIMHLRMKGNQKDLNEFLTRLSFQTVIEISLNSFQTIIDASIFYFILHSLVNGWNNTRKANIMATIEQALDTITLTSSFTSTSTRWNYTRITERNSGWSHSLNARFTRLSW